MTPHYATSRDYALMRELLEYGPLMGWVDYAEGRDGKLRSCTTIASEDDGWCVTGDYGFYGDHWLEFTALCKKYNLEFVLPNGEMGNG